MKVPAPRVRRGKSVVRQPLRAWFSLCRRRV